MLNLNPSSIGLTQQNPRRVITLTNVAGTGTNGATITNLVLPTLSAPLQFESTNCTSTLAVGNSCIYTIKYSSAVSANQASLPFTYNNGVSAGQTASLAVDWSVSTPPQLSSETPVNNSVDVSLATSVSITFDESMDLTTLVASNFQLQKITDSSFITLSSPIYSIDGKTVTFATSSGTANPALVASSEYKIIIPVPANIKNAIGTSLNLPLVEYPNGVISTFTTANVTQCGNTAWAGILNSATNSFTKCLWQSDGSLYDCSGGDTPIGLFSTPSVILPDGYGSLYSANSGANSLAYYIGANYGSVFNSPSPLVSLTTPAISGAQVKYNLSKGFVFVNTTGGLNICGINTGTGALTTCAAASPAGLSPDAYGSGFSSNGSGSGIFWTANKNANTVSFCPATSDNPTVIAQCNDAGGSKFNQPSAIYATNTYVLVANAGDNTIVRCDQSSGVLSNCAYTGGNINGPSSIVAGASYSSNFIYVTNKVDNSVTVCKNSGGVLSSCNRMIYPSGTFNSPTSIYVYDACSAG